MFNCEENESMERTDGMEEEEMREQCLQKEKQTGCHASGWDFMWKISKKYIGTGMRGVMLGQAHRANEQTAVPSLTLTALRSWSCRIKMCTGMNCILSLENSF